jgi:hypothetical protein
VTAALATSAEPRFCTPRTDRATYGGEVAKLARLLGFTPMLHQQLFWDIALEHDPGGVLAYREIGWTISRQCGKSTALLLLMLWRCLRWAGQVVRYGAQSGMDARAKLADDWWPLLEHSPLAEVLTFRRQSGHEALIFESGSRLGLVASSEKSGHGSTLDTAILDESWAHADHRLEQSCRPAMVTRDNAQMYVVSTAGTERRSPFLFEKVQAGRQAAEAGITDGMAYLEWSAPDDADPSDPETWRRAIPALGVTISEATVRGDYLGMQRHEFMRSFLNMWTSTMGSPIVDLDEWATFAEPDAPRPEWVVLGADIGPKGKSAAITAVGERDGLLYAAVLEHGEGSDWLLPALARLVTDRPYVIVDEKSMAHLLPEIKATCGVDHVIALTAREVPPACEFWLRIVNEGKLRHRGEPELAIALDGAGQRSLGDGWAWSRAKSGCDITPLTSLTFAVEFYRGSWGTQ